MSYAETWSPSDAFARYEAIADRLPKAHFSAAPQMVDGLRAVAAHVDAFVLDSFGVLNVGDAPIPGAVDCLAALRAMGKRLVVLTNAASYPKSDALLRYRRLGFDFSAREVVSSRDVCAARLHMVLPKGRWGAIAAPEDRFEDLPGEVQHWSPDQDAAADGILFLSSAALSPERYAALQDCLRARPRPVVTANPDLVAPRESGLSKEPGYYINELADALGMAPLFFGKPFADAFSDARAVLGEVPAERIAMVGDTLHTDILGGRAAGMRTVLIRDHGLFAGLDVATFIAQSGIVPDFISHTV